MLVFPNLVSRGLFLCPSSLSLNNFMHFFRFKVIVKMKTHTLSEALSHGVFHHHQRSQPTSPAGPLLWTPDSPYATTYHHHCYPPLQPTCFPHLSRHHHQWPGSLCQIFKSFLISPFFYSQNTKYHPLLLFLPERQILFYTLFSIFCLLSLHSTMPTCLTQTGATACNIVSFAITFPFPQSIFYIVWN